ncbi:sulfotransferase family 2 domain-containing protein [Halalkalibacter alkalisediminis]|uniref:sulfotransferase family 2 domain-containing protein n=1 Tax=Halalkalibacter alkalisediminis TaxID=935616 RepID=UPI0023603093|nr:sulfotransferase family 2 domain-containing protein [Halalkalibacter alkalisediminis]
MQRNKILIHLHTPKTAGTTLRKIITNNYHNSSYNVYLDESKRKERLRSLSKKNVSCIQGHFPFGIHKYLSKPCTYITMLRNPIDRVISEYYFIRRGTRHRLHQEVMKLSLEQYLRRPESMNVQTRYISGARGPLTRQHLEIAKKNIQKYFSIVGITEMFNESLFLMKNKFGWQNTSYEKENVTKARPSLNQISKTTLTELEKQNKLDIELYLFAKRLLEQKLINLDQQSKQELNTFLSKSNNQ